MIVETEKHACTRPEQKYRITYTKRKLLQTRDKKKIRDRKYRKKITCFLFLAPCFCSLFRKFLLPFFLCFLRHVSYFSSCHVFVMNFIFYMYAAVHWWFHPGMSQPGLKKSSVYMIVMIHPGMRGTSNLYVELTCSAHPWLRKVLRFDVDFHKTYLVHAGRKQLCGYMIWRIVLWR